MQRRLIFLACFFICADCFAQQYPFVYYTPKDGLVNSRVRSIKQDSKGRMLFITYGGLSIYDGTRFTNYGLGDGLANELVNDVVEISPDSFLVATNVPKLNTLVHGRIGTYHTTDNFYPIINRFFKSNDGNWYVAADEGLFLFRDKRFIHLPLLNKERKDVGYYLDRILEWGNFFLITLWNPERKEKLILYDRLSKRVLDIDTKNKIINYAADREGRIWITLAEDVMLIDTMALLKGKINFQPMPAEYKGIVQKSSFIFFDAQNNMWFYNRNGILKISPKFHKQVFTTQQGLQATNLSDLFVDREGIAWFATDGNGIIKLKNDNITFLNSTGRSQAFTTIANKNDTIWLFSSNTIYRIYQDEFKSFVLTGKKMNAANLYIRDQKIYLSDDNKLLCIKNKNKQGSYYHPLSILDNTGQNISLGNGLIDENGNIIQYARKNDSLFLLLVYKENKLIYETSISYMVDQIICDKEGRLWLATRNNHLMVFAIHPEQPFQYLQLLKEYTSELPEINPRCITLDTSDNVWIGTRYNGVNKLEFDGLKLRKVTEFSTQNGLTDNFVYSINCDENNTIWVGTQTGLDKIFQKNGRFITGNVSKNNNFFQAIRKIAITKNNTVWALTGEGSILKISPESSYNFSSNPHFLFTSIQVNNQSYSDSLSIFSYWQNNFSFNVAALSFIDEKAIIYSYLLEGSGNNSWSRPSNNSNFNFINLSPGHYVLKVKSEFPEAVYPPRVISYSFTIRPPWWQTWWFIIIIGLLSAGLLISIIRFYYRRKLEKQRVFLEKQQAIEKERTRIATDMHDDLGAGLSRIKFLSETIGLKKQQKIPFEEDISKIREYSHEMIDKMGEIVWALNEKNDSLSDLISYTRSYTAEYLAQSGISCTIDSPESLPANFVSGEFRRNIFLSIKEILHNIVKHSQANHVDISIQTDHGLYINIKDDGIGFDRDKIRPYRNGLINIGKRMKEIGGIMEIQTTNGTLVKLIAPLS